MKGFSDKYVESIIKRTIKGSMAIRDSAIRLGISRQYIKKYAKIGRRTFCRVNPCRDGGSFTWGKNRQPHQR